MRSRKRPLDLDLRWMSTGRSCFRQASSTNSTASNSMSAGKSTTTSRSLSNFILVFCSGAEDQKPSAPRGAEGPHFGHDEICRGPPSGGPAGLSLGNGHDAWHRLFSIKLDIV